jgi:hypothetical protein
MNRRFLILAFCFLVLFELATAPVMAGGDKTPQLASPTNSFVDPDNPPPPREFNFCSSVCPSGGPCDSCRLGPAGGTTTCGQYAGHPANDLDGDGVIDTVDNCQCLANANQANCDGDAYGDACDSQDNSWTQISVGTQACLKDEDQHFPQITLEFYYRDVYRSACTGQTCYKKYLRGTKTCNYWDDTAQCCKAKWIPLTDCGGAWGWDTCGLPRCTF